MILKWIFDRVVAFIGLLFLWPVLLIVAILVKIKMPGGPAFFVQKRVGKGGKLFDCYKFRTMRVQSHTDDLSPAEITENAERIGLTDSTDGTDKLSPAEMAENAERIGLTDSTDGTDDLSPADCNATLSKREIAENTERFGLTDSTDGTDDLSPAEKQAGTNKNSGWSTVSVAGDNRITPLGATLRHYKLDELPGLWNVLIGEMSFVGPRPDVPGYADKLQGDDRDVLKLRPGITGPATMKYRLEDEMIAEYIRTQRSKGLTDGTDGTDNLSPAEKAENAERIGLTDSTDGTDKLSPAEMAENAERIGLTDSTDGTDDLSPAERKEIAEIDISMMTDQELAEWYNDNVIYPDKVRLNCYYYRHYSFIKDIQMIVCTVLGKKMMYAGEEI